MSFMSRFVNRQAPAATPPAAQLPSDQPHYRPGDLIGGNFLVHHVLGGGMGEVYLCLDLEQNYPFALKTLRQQFFGDPQMYENFRHEVATWVALESHPNIVRCFYMANLDNLPFMVMEWVAGAEGMGTDLQSWLRYGPLDLRLALEFMIDICNGLNHAGHQQPGIVHRDLKPANVLIAQDRVAKITDFGLAAIIQKSALAHAAGATVMSVGQSVIGANGAVGTPQYMAPEQWRAASVDVRTDIYALGCMLYELLSGQPPYLVDVRGKSLDEIYAGLQQMHERAAVPQLPDGFPMA
jgi:serine/threonine-protein kinase